MSVGVQVDKPDLIYSGASLTATAYGDVQWNLTPAGEEPKPKDTEGPLIKR